MSEIKRKLKIMMGLIFGGLLVGGVALLMAPQSGEKTRQMIKANAASAYEHSRGRMVEVLEGAQGGTRRLVNGIRQDAQRILNPQYAHKLVAKE